MLSRTRGYLVLALLPVAAACSDDTSPPPSECPEPQAAFELVVMAKGGSLPADTRLEVTFSSGTERYDMAAPDATLEAVRCARRVEQEQVTALECALWTDGPASVEVTAGGFEPISEDLAHETDDCGIRTVDVSLSLEPEKN